MKKTPQAMFEEQCRAEIEQQGKSGPARAAALAFMLAARVTNYSYHFEQFGRPIIQYPQDIVAMQELIWRVRPDLVIETGIAHGGSLVLSAGMLALLDYCDAAGQRVALDPMAGRRRVIGIDIDIRPHNRAAIEAHPLAHKIEMIQGSSVDPAVVDAVRARSRDFDRVLVCLDSNHAHAHVLAELEAYADLVTPGSYCVVFDTVIEDRPLGSFPGRPWDKGNNPMTAVHEFLRARREFVIDSTIQDKLLITVAPDGFLKRL